MRLTDRISRNLPPPPPHSLVVSTFRFSVAQSIHCEKRIVFISYTLLLGGGIHVQISVFLSCVRVWYVKPEALCCPNLCACSVCSFCHLQAGFYRPDLMTDCLVIRALSFDWTGRLFKLLSVFFTSASTSFHPLFSITNSLIITSCFWGEFTHFYNTLIAFAF